ncbi:hypothetical protein [Pseudodesulfovibrio nedwellii]|nr:hypothetical protein [Pseudodesulfovibrio nedwellii]
MLLLREVSTVKKKWHLVKAKGIGSVCSAVFKATEGGACRQLSYTEF